MFANTTVVIALQYTNVSNQHVVYLKLTYLYFNKNVHLIFLILKSD